MALAFTVIGCGKSNSNPTAPLPAAPEWVLSGTVRGNGVALSVASVVIRNQPLPTFVMRTTTDADGRYLFPAVAQGTYFVEAGATGYVTVILPVALTSSRSVDFDLPLNPAR